jgi:hypothetical protein
MKPVVKELHHHYYQVRNQTVHVLLVIMVLMVQLVNFQINIIQLSHPPRLLTYPTSSANERYVYVHL